MVFILPILAGKKDAVNSGPLTGYISSKDDDISIDFIRKEIPVIQGMPRCIWSSLRNRPERWAQHTPFS
jgi:hypothetical protein